MDPLFGILILVGFFGGLALILIPTLWFHYRDEAQKRDKVHAERMRSLELGMPLQDAQIERIGTLRWIGLGVPLAALAMALGATALVIFFADMLAMAWVLVAVWLSCGCVGAVAVHGTMQRLRENAERDRSLGHVQTQPTEVADVRPPVADLERAAPSQAFSEKPASFGSRS